jgi:hypothetical protein
MANARFIHTEINTPAGYIASDVRLARVIYCRA